jgi:uncharacterized protein YcbK (DUF882 family)
MYITWQRGSNLPLSAHFNAKEFTCQCGMCRPQKIKNDLITKLERVREKFGRPLIITSGYRCARHQASLRGQGLQTASGTSTHELGEAADVRPKDLADMPELLKILEEEFKAIGLASTFYHVDLRADKIRRWKYV